MRATTLKKKYPELWESVENQIMDGNRFNYRIDVIAQNAAFVACSETHKIIKALAKVKK